MEYVSYKSYRNKGVDRYNGWTEIVNSPEYKLYDGYDEYDGCEGYEQ